MNQNDTRLTKRTPQEVTALIRTFFSHMQIRLTEYQSHEDLLGSYAVHLQPVHSSSRAGFCGTGITAARARAGAYLQCMCKLCTQPDLPLWSLRKKDICTDGDPSERITCAGSTPAEALVQGISDLLRRKAAAGWQDSFAAPGIPESLPAGYPEANRMYRLLKEQYGERIRLSDISGDGIQFSAALHLQNPQKYEPELTYSSHPDTGFALERLFVNAVNGSSFSEALYLGDYDAEQCLSAMLHALFRQGYDLLIGDCSCAGLSIYQLMIPGMAVRMQCHPLPDTLAFHAAIQRCRAYRLAHPSDPEQSFAALTALCG